MPSRDHMLRNNVTKNIFGKDAMRISRLVPALAVVLFGLSVGVNKMPQDIRLLATVILTAVAVVAICICIVRYIRFVWKRNVDGGELAIPVIPAMSQLLLPFTFLPALAAIDNTHHALASMGLVLSTSMAYSQIFFLLPLMTHLCRPWDSVESRAERNAAGLTMLTVMFLMMTLGVVETVIIRDVHASRTWRYIPYGLVILMVCEYTALRELLIRWPR